MLTHAAVQAFDRVCHCWVHITEVGIGQEHWGACQACPTVWPCKNAWEGDLRQPTRGSKLLLASIKDLCPYP